MKMTFNFKAEKNKLDRRDPVYYDKLNALVQKKRLCEALEKTPVLMGAKIQIR